MDFKYIKSLYNERKLTKQELKKREEIAQAIERDHPDIPMDRKMAIATAAAKRDKDTKHFSIDETHVSQYDAVVTYYRSLGMDPYKLKGEVGKQARDKIKKSPAFIAWKKINNYESFEILDAKLDSILSEKISSKKDSIVFLNYPDKKKKSADINNKDEANVDDNFLTHN